MYDLKGWEIFPRNVQTFQAIPAPQVTEAEVHSDYLCSHNTLKTFIRAGISHLWKLENPTWATLPLPNKEYFRAGTGWNTRNCTHETANLISSRWKYPAVHKRLNLPKRSVTVANKDSRHMEDYFSPLLSIIV